MRKSVPHPVVRFGPTGTESVPDRLVIEGPVEFRLSGVPIAVLMRSPGDDESLARGFALSESIILEPAEFAGLEPAGSAAGDDRWNIKLRRGVIVDAEQFRRNTYTTSSCGVCGKASIDAVRIAARTALPGPELAEELIHQIAAEMRDNQTEFDLTGGLHAAAAFTPTGELLTIQEDVGRHNAVDKMIGELARTRWPLTDIVVMLSGRVSFEIVQKCAVVGISVVCGVSAASSLAVELGAELNMTVIGFVRDQRFNVYTGAERIIGRPAPQ